MCSTQTCKQLFVVSLFNPHLVKTASLCRCRPNACKKYLQLYFLSPFVPNTCESLRILAARPPPKQEHFICLIVVACSPQPATKICIAQFSAACKFFVCFCAVFYNDLLMPFCSKAAQKLLRRPSEAVEVWVSSGRESSGRLHTEKLPINRPSGRYAI